MYSIFTFDVNVLKVRLHCILRQKILKIIQNIIDLVNVTSIINYVISGNFIVLKIVEGIII